MKIVDIQPKYKSIIKVLFMDGFCAEIESESFVDQGLSEPLSNFEYFKTAYIDNLVIQ
jgi:hypothetical protein